MSENDSENSSDQKERKYGTAIKKGKRSIDKGSRSGRKCYSSEDYFSSVSDYEDQKERKGDKNKRNKKRYDDEDVTYDLSSMHFAVILFLRFLFSKKKLLCV